MCWRIVTVSQSIEDQLPPFLRSYGDLKDYVDSQLDNLPTNAAKGTAFARFVQGIVPISDLGSQFNEPEMQQHSHDGGVDLKAQNADGTKMLYIQSKLTMRGVDDLDAIIQS